MLYYASKTRATDQERKTKPGKYQQYKKINQKYSKKLVRAERSETDLKCAWATSLTFILQVVELQQDNMADNMDMMNMQLPLLKQHIEGVYRHRDDQELIASSRHWNILARCVIGIATQI